MNGPENPPAFPSQLHEARDPGDHDPQYGMTLRDWFAGQAAIGILANSENAVAGAEPTNAALSIRPYEFAGWVARTSYLVGDAMLAERAKALGK